MRSLTDYQAFDQRVLLSMAGQDPKECRQIAADVEADVFDVRASLLRLMQSGHVLEHKVVTGARSTILYEKAHGGSSPDPVAA